MASSASIRTKNEITLVTLQNCPATPDFTAKVFANIGQLGVNVDMISITPSHGVTTSISFTIDDNDLGKLLRYTSTLHEKAKVSTLVSSGNNIITVHDSGMIDAPGVAAKVFAATASVHTDLRIVTTSEVDISLLVTDADFNPTLEALQKIIF